MCFRNILYVDVYYYMNFNLDNLVLSKYVLSVYFVEFNIVNCFCYKILLF